jgi:hypothetical protein
MTRSRRKSILTLNVLTAAVALVAVTALLLSWMRAASASQGYWLTERAMPAAYLPTGTGWELGGVAWLDTSNGCNGLAGGDVLMQPISAGIYEAISAVDVDVVGAESTRPASPLSFQILRVTLPSGELTWWPSPSTSYVDAAPCGSGAGEYGGPHQITSGLISITIEPGYDYFVILTGESGAESSAGDVFYATQRYTIAASAAYPN